MAAFEEQHDERVTKEQPWPACLLNENHRRSLATVLRQVELAVWRLEERLTWRTSPQLVLTRFSNPPDSAQQAALLHLVNRVRREIAKLAVDYNLEVSDENVLRGIMGEFTLL